MGITVPRQNKTFSVWYYVEDEKMLQLAQFKLGAHINKIIEYQIRNTENNDE